MLHNRSITLQEHRVCVVDASKDVTNMTMLSKLGSVAMGPNGQKHPTGLVSKVDKVRIGKRFCTRPDATEDEGAVVSFKSNSNLNAVCIISASPEKAKRRH